ncbi:MAG: IS1595 family transposase, partial [Patescibacteria group bacterium]
MKNKYLNKAHISERKFREILRFFTEDETASKTAKYSGISRNSI